MVFFSGVAEDESLCVDSFVAFLTYVSFPCLIILLLAMGHTGLVPNITFVHHLLTNNMQGLAFHYQQDSLVYFLMTVNFASQKWACKPDLNVSLVTSVLATQALQHSLSNSIEGFFSHS